VAAAKLEPVARGHAAVFRSAIGDRERREKQYKELRRMVGPVPNCFFLFLLVDSAVDSRAASHMHSVHHVVHVFVLPVPPQNSSYP
jgi:hypothetical protein